MNSKADMITKSDLKDRGWTDKLISTFVPKADLTKMNPHYRSGPPMRLYCVDRIRTIEATKEFRAEKRKSDRRKLAAMKAIASKRDMLMKEVEEIEFSISIFTEEELIRRACDSYNGMGKMFFAGPNSDSEFLDRICVNYLRHEATHYDVHLDEIYGRVGKDEAYSALRRKVLDAIADAYPWLAQECMNQRFRERDVMGHI